MAKRFRNHRPNPNQCIFICDNALILGVEQPNIVHRKPTLLKCKYAKTTNSKNDFTELVYAKINV